MMCNLCFGLRTTSTRNVALMKKTTREVFCKISNIDGGRLIEEVIFFVNLLFIKDELFKQ